MTVKGMKIGYLHVGPPEHGVCRYGRLLATAARQHNDVAVIEASVMLGNNRNHNRTLLIQAAQTLSEADVIHFQFNKFGRTLWGEGWAQIHHLRLFMDHCSAPLVVTLHDVFYPPYRLATVLRQAQAKWQTGGAAPKPSVAQALSAPAVHPSHRPRWRKGVGFLQSIFNGWFGAEAIALQAIVRRAALILVCTREEATRLTDRVARQTLQVIPHFVEERSIQVSPTAARQTLGLENTRIVTLLGFIYQPKGHHLLVEAIPALPEDVTVVLAGGSSSSYYDAYVESLIATATANGVAHRLRITGYLSEADLELYLRATDLAVCPFTRFSASGSLSTWISVERPILASDLPQIAEYNQLEPNAIHLFTPCTSSALAAAIERVLPQCTPEGSPAVSRLRQKLSMAVIFNQHLAHYRRLGSTDQGRSQTMLKSVT
ncbi:glycosyltransferase [Oculatella sp. LEGE 06141]|uniref:glycosyltransferase n=1 Tax=Oculatella sp. LEGE 06141 TaxID=1828648 RepID=UPI001882417E|nr:glycosyltransferase [Oculatella sp. LEGE 06141]MBE9179721.1 glycosyltransferase [Oculatella sp. LEGE 06141]